MQRQTQHPELQDWQRLVGGWAIEAAHPGLPDTVVTGRATFEWLEDQRFLLQRSHYDHPDIPDAIAVTGIIDGKPSMHYFDPRGVHRVFAVDITPNTWRFWNDAPGFSQRVTHSSATTAARSTVRPSCRAMTVLPGSTTLRSPIAGSADLPATGAVAEQVAGDDLTRGIETFLAPLTRTRQRRMDAAPHHRIPASSRLTGGVGCGGSGHAAADEPDRQGDQQQRERDQPAALDELE
jgi:hypothetical protein